MMIMRMRRTVENGSAFTLGARTVPERSKTVELTVLFLYGTERLRLHYAGNGSRPVRTVPDLLV